MPSTDTLELEQVERAVTKLLALNLNDAIDAQNVLWTQRDDDFYTALGRPNPSVQVEHVEPQNFYPGHVPSLIDAPIDRYPNVAAMAFRGQVLQSSDDWAEQYALGLGIEVMCRSLCESDKPDPEEDAEAAEAVNSRIKRTMAAVHACLKSDDARSFGGLVPRVGNTPDVLVTDVFVRKQEKARGPRWFWCGGRMDYRVQTWVNY